MNYIKRAVIDVAVDGDWEPGMRHLGRRFCYSARDKSGVSFHAPIPHSNTEEKKCGGTSKKGR